MTHVLTEGRKEGSKYVRCRGWSHRQLASRYADAEPEPVSFIVLEGFDTSLST